MNVHMTADNNIAVIEASPYMIQGKAIVGNLLRMITVARNEGLKINIYTYNNTVSIKGDKIIDWIADWLCENDLDARLFDRNAKNYPAR